MLTRVRAAIAVVLRQKGYVSVVDVLVEMKRLTPAHLDDWRFGRIPYLEGVVQGNLSKLSLIGREIRSVAQAQGLKPSVTVYRKWGRGPKRTLRFSKSGEPSVERAYATHWLSKRGRAEPPREMNATGASPPVDGRSRRMEATERASSPGRPESILQPDVPIARDPERVRHLAAENRRLPLLPAPAEEAHDDPAVRRHRQRERLPYRVQRARAGASCSASSGGGVSSAVSANSLVSPTWRSRRRTASWMRCATLAWRAWSGGAPSSCIRPHPGIPTPNF